MLLPSALRLLTPLLLLATSSTAATWDCHNIVVDNKDFNLGELAGPKEVHWVKETPPSFVNTTFTVDICDPLPKKDGECPEGTHICGIQRTYHPDDKETPKIDKVIPIAGPFTDDSKPKIKKLEKDDSDKQKGLHIELGAGSLPAGRQGIQSWAPKSPAEMRGFSFKVAKQFLKGLGRQKWRHFCSGGAPNG